MTASTSKLLRLLRHLETPAIEQPRVIGIDDWAFRKRRSYGMLIIDHERGEPIDLLPERDGESVKQWLDEHPTVEIGALRTFREKIIEMSKMETSRSKITPGEKCHAHQYFITEHLKTRQNDFRKFNDNLSSKFDTKQGDCPDCYYPCQRVHSWYTRTVADLPCGEPSSVFISMFSDF